MNNRAISFRRCIILIAALGALQLPARALAEPKVEKQDRMTAQLVCEFLKRGHVSHPEIGDDISRRLFRRFIKDLDPAKLYFLKSDIDEFKKQETELDDQILKGDLDFAYAVYDKFLTRIGERQKLIEELVQAKQDYTVKESLDTDYDAMDYAANAEEIRERWRKRIKFDLLVLQVGAKPIPEDEAKKKVLARYQGVQKRWKQVDNSDLLEIYLTELSASIDPHTTYMSPGTLADFEIALRLNLDGIGALLGSENGQTQVKEIIPGGPAAKDGRLKANDTIVGVAQGDDKFVDTPDMKLRDVVKMIRGKRDTKVQLKVIPVGKLEPVVYELTRAKVELKSQEARGDIVEQGKKADGTPYLIGVIDLPSFYADGGAGKAEKSATEDVRRLLKEFEAKHVDGVVLDLRRNGGGLLGEAIALTGLFIDQGTVVQVKTSGGTVKRLDDPEKGAVYTGPLMVLTSRFSASASEIVAGALQDYGRALVVGDTTTHGKGTVQTVIDLGDQVPQDPHPKIGALKLTIQQFYRPNGDSTQVKGVVSDVVLPTLTEQLATAEKDLENALAFDKVKAADHEDLNLVPAEVKLALKERSAKRVKESKDFEKLAKEVEQFKERKIRKKITLNEKELKEQFTKDDTEKIDQKANEFLQDPPEEGTYKFKKNFMNDEVLKIMEDFMQGKKLIAER